MSTVGIDVGGTKILAVHLVDGEATAVHKVKTPRTGPNDVFDRVVDVWRKVDPEARATSLGVGVPGKVDPESGTLEAPPNLAGFEGTIHVGSALAKRTGRVVLVDNDVNVATLAEHRLGAGRGVDNLLGVFMGTGVGGGLVLDGRLRRGPRGLAGEFGHMVIRRKGRPCGCGLNGHVESYAGRASLERQARKRHAAGEATMLVELAGEHRMRSSVWETAINAGDEVAIDLVDEAVDAIVAGLVSATVLIDLELIVLGGGFAHRLGEPFRRRIERAFLKATFADSGVPVVRSKLGDNAGAIGAALLPLQRS
ncbi:MAG: ROK family protein [Acidimicrobiales bacterium]|nr:ROK family protein [Acidimicrobiales bacterium]